MLWEKGIRFEKLVVLTGQRPLDKTLESSQLLLDTTHPTLHFKQGKQLNVKLPSTEIGMINYTFNHIKMPKTWEAIPFVYVDTPMQKTENGILRRPNTQDTINEWLTRYNPKPGSILALSNQPFVGYQDAVLRKYLPPNFVIDTVGDVDWEDEGVATILDSLTRWIYNATF